MTEGLLLGFHLKGAPIEVLVHKILVITIAASAAVMFAEICCKGSVLLTLARALLVILQGMWFIQIGYILFTGDCSIIIPVCCSARRYASLRMTNAVKAYPTQRTLCDDRRHSGVGCSQHEQRHDGACPVLFGHHAPDAGQPNGCVLIRSGSPTLSKAVFMELTAGCLQVSCSCAWCTARRLHTRNWNRTMMQRTPALQLVFSRDSQSPALLRGTAITRVYSWLPRRGLHCSLVQVAGS